ncbi:M protein repeat protein-like protein [Phyllosticta citribraziliensis]|uniref:M protein repeat protein-like protein n=1 Tax=Phyllosticta citribraziliensis TaxID=989973 RepID=A0ABR1LLM7_9PEZI
MSAPPKPKQSTKWGGFLSSAVAGLESRLDTILAEDDQASARSRADEAALKKAAYEQALSRNPSRSTGNRANDRLQERLAKAVKEQRSRSSSELPSRTASPSLAETSRTSVDSRNSDAPSSAIKEHANLSDDAAEQIAADESKNNASTIPDIAVEDDVLEQDDAPTPQELFQPDSSITPTSRPDDPLKPQSVPQTFTEESEDVAALREAYEELSMTHREEITANLERIDALQAKLKYLASQAATSARSAANDSDAGPVDRKLAEKDEQIALLMEEGQALSKKELNCLNTIKKLRAKVGEDEKAIAELRRRLAKAEASVSDATDRAKRAESQAKVGESKAKQLEKVEKEKASFKAERDEANRLVEELKRQVVAANDRAGEAEKKAQKSAGDDAKRRVAELQDELSDARIEKKLAEDRAKKEAQDAKDEAERQRERAKIVENELRGEIGNLETKLEVLRSRTEEVSSAASGDSQIKLLRQIETLQTQYALASENWQGIESSLTSRVVALEKERDELAKRESEVRRRAREANSKSRKLEDELEGTSERARALGHELSQQKTTMADLQAKVKQAEKELEAANAKFEQHKKIWDAELRQRLDEERSKLRNEMQAALQSPISPEAPLPHLLGPQTPSTQGGTFSRKHSTTGDGGIHSRRNISRNVSSELLLSLEHQSPGSGRRTSNFAQRTPGVPPSIRQESSSSVARLNGSKNVPSPPSIHPIEPEEDFERTSSPHRTVADMISVSTVGAGPSVQLVERMSAAVRRLESEKAVSKEEMARLAAQRDEAREEVVALMREIETKRAADQKVDRLQKELTELNNRYETTLEMLGEKSEQVEELKNDVEDLKKIYKDLVERTMK